MQSSSDKDANSGIFETVKKNAQQGVQTFSVKIREPWAQALLRLLVLFVVIVFLAVAVIVLTKLYQTYPRLFWIGHSEDLRKYMRDHVKLMVMSLYTIRNRGEKDHPLTGLVDKYFRLDAVPPAGLSEYDEDNAPFMYLPYMFRRALTTGEVSRRKKMELSVYRQLMNGVDTLKLGNRKRQVYQEQDNGQIRDDVIPLIQERVRVFTEIQDYFGRMLCKYRGDLGYDTTKRKCKLPYKWCKRKSRLPGMYSDAHAEMARLNLALLTTEYAPHLERMYDLRKSGGVGNFVIYDIYMSQYINFIFHEQIPGIWKSFGENVKSTGELYIRVVGSEKVSRFMASIPVRMISDSFQNPPEDWEDGGKESEYFFQNGFTNLIEGLVMLIPNLLKVIMAFVNVIVNPLLIVKYILALVIGVILYILYMVLVVISPIFYVPAFFWVLSINVVLTLLWVLIFVSIGIVYFVLWILNQATGGVVFDMLRCENLPNAWFEKAGYALGNIFSRGLFCNFPCRAGWRPSGCLCRRTPPNQPNYCPQQLLMQRYVRHALGKAEEGRGFLDRITEGNTFYDFVPGPKYYAGNTDEKKRMLDEYLHNEERFAGKCAKELSVYECLTRHICENAQALGLADDPLLNRACKYAFCKRFYDGDCKKHEFVLLFKTRNKPPEGKNVLPLDAQDLRRLRKYGESLTPRPYNMYLLNQKEGEVVYMTSDPQLGEIFPRGPYLPSFCEEIADRGNQDLNAAKFWNRPRALPHNEKPTYYVLYALLVLTSLSMGAVLLTRRIRGG